MIIPYVMGYSLSCRAHWISFTSFQVWIKVRDPSNGKAKLWMVYLLLHHFGFAIWYYMCRLDPMEAFIEETVKLYLMYILSL